MKKKLIANKILLLITIIFITLNVFTNDNYSVEPEEFLENSKLEFRARKISKNIRCMVCQNQSIDESSAPLAKDLRILIRDKIKKGHSDKKIYEFLTDRYGDFILLNPPLKQKTFALWFLPFIFLIAAIILIFFHNSKSKKFD